MITIRQIKEYYELVSDINDLSTKSREREIVDVRFSFYKSCKMHTNESLAKIGLFAGRTHATVLHGIKEFDNLYSGNNFTAKKIYTKVEEKINVVKKNCKSDFDIMKCQDVELVKQYFRIKHIQHTEKSHNIIRNLQFENIMLQKKLDATLPTMLNEIRSLNIEDYNELAERVNLFLKVKNLMKPKKT